MMIKVFVNGTFDVLHPGHIALLKHAASIGNYLLVAIDSDRRVKQLKGHSRPFFTAMDRKSMLESVVWVNAVEIFDTDEELEHIIQTYEPDVMVKGSDYVGKPIVGEEFVPRIKFFERINEYSSTKAIQNLTGR